MIMDLDYDGNKWRRHYDHFIIIRWYMTIRKWSTISTLGPISVAGSEVCAWAQVGSDFYICEPGLFSPLVLFPLVETLFPEPWVAHLVVPRPHWVPAPLVRLEPFHFGCEVVVVSNYETVTFFVPRFAVVHRLLILPRLVSSPRK